MADEEKVESGGDSSEKEDTPVTNGLPEFAEPTPGASAGSKKKKKKKKGKKKDETTGLVPSTQALAQLQKAMGKMRFNDAMTGGKGKEKGNVFEKKYEFWDTQPVPKLSEYIYIEIRYIYITNVYFSNVGVFLYHGFLGFCLPYLLPLGQ